MYVYVCMYVSALEPGPFFDPVTRRPGKTIDPVTQRPDDPVFYVTSLYMYLYSSPTLRLNYKAI